MRHSLTYEARQITGDIVRGKANASHVVLANHNQEMKKCCLGCSADLGLFIQHT